MKIRGKVVLMKKNYLEWKDHTASWEDRWDDICGHKVFLQLVSSVNGDPAQGLRGMLGKPARLKRWKIPTSIIKASDSKMKVKFDWVDELGVPGAFIIKNHHQNEFFLKTLTLEDVPGHGRVLFICNSWVYPEIDRIFFTNQAYLPSETPATLRWYREKELENLRGDGLGQLEESDRVYDYDAYNDLGNPDEGSEYYRPVLGGSTEYPYPRRGRTGRTGQTDRKSLQDALSDLQEKKNYVPRDEQFGHIKMSDFSAYSLKSTIHHFIPSGTSDEFDTFEDVIKLCEGKFTVSEKIDKMLGKIPFELVKKLVRTNGEAYFKFPMPKVIKEDKNAWMTDEEFAREMLAGMNPVIICRLQEFPPTSKLDPKVYGNQTSSITRDHIGNNLEDLSIDEAIKNNRLFILDYHDALMTYLRRINSTSTKTYATRTLLFLKKDGTLQPLAIELSRPHPEGDQFGAISKVYTPAERGAEGSTWLLAKAYVSINDYGYHQLISHWLNTHAVIEPFVIAMNRQLSVLHPIYKLLHPHFRYTMCINAFARMTLINAGGLVEEIFFPAKFSMEFSSMVYKNWVFPEQSLPADLIKRGVAIEDSNSPHGLRLLIEDYPYAVDGLQIWSAIKTWVEDYCSFYYKNNEMVQNDSELRSWWEELREKGHADKKYEPWWPKMETCKELIETCTIIIWVTSAVHAAVNFGQYPYAGYLPNRPSLSRRFMPEPDTPEYRELERNREKAFLETITAKEEALRSLFLVEILSRHSSDELYLGQRDNPEWTKDTEPLKAFEKFGKKLKEIEKRITEMNTDPKWKNRVGPVKVPYTLLYPTGEVGLSGKGIPNSISI
ncbi:hypothetical protein F0562_019986 [Nyssa sinensis]|uniref:Lipoxygenase n=1 Tax=Nyssa sinensis TaxID=561372 RepID=A0A5J5BQ87_9ASTE|nr:hypothetical protein F0562_019986 [Nyssa sinensis]